MSGEKRLSVHTEGSPSRSASRRRPPPRSFGLHWFREEQRLGDPRCSRGSGRERLRPRTGPRCKPQMRAVRFHRPVGSKLSVGTKFATSWTRAATTAHAARWISLTVRRSQYYAHRALPACVCHLCSPHRRHCGFCPSAAEGCAAGGDVEGFPIRRSVTRARGHCKRCGASLITRAHRGAPRECLRICKQDVFKDKPARRGLEICAVQ